MRFHPSAQGCAIRTELHVDDHILARAFAPRLGYILILLTFLWGCSKEPKTESANSNASSESTLALPPGVAPVELPFQLTVVESEETKEINRIKAEEIALLKSKDYGSLDLMAHRYRESKECFANGLSKLNAFYVGFELEDQEPEALWQDRLSALKAWIQERPKSVTARIAFAHFLTDYAWKARGSGYANTVADEGWQLFGQRLQQGANVLSHLEELDEPCPHKWMVIERVALGLSAPRTVFEKIFEKSISEVPGYTGYYYRQAIYLLPRWFGNEGEWENALAKGADQVGGEAGDMLYARVVWLMQEYNVAQSNIFKECSISPTRVDKGFELIQKQFPGSLSAKSKRAYFACLAGNQKVAREVFDSLGGKVDLSVWKTEQKFVRFARWAYGR